MMLSGLPYFERLAHGSLYVTEDDRGYRIEVDPDAGTARSATGQPPIILRTNDLSSSLPRLRRMLRRRGWLDLFLLARAA